MNLYDRLSEKQVSASAPCRVDFGGTLDIATFFLAMTNQAPATFNLALDLRTQVDLAPHTPGKIMVSSKGFESAEFSRGKAPFNHPLGLIFAVAQYFDVHGLHIKINSTSPPRSALGGSSSAEVSVIAAIMNALDMPLHGHAIVHLAQAIESSAAGVVCGVQDHTAAVFGNANLWKWNMGKYGWDWKQTSLFANPQDAESFQDHFIVAYCGIPHISVHVNQLWVKDFIEGNNREEFVSIARLTHEFFSALSVKDYSRAGSYMNEETMIRLGMTPDVLDKTGKILFELARANNCGARFTGAGGGGCLWGLGEARDLKKLAVDWKKAVESIDSAVILDVRPDLLGLMVNQGPLNLSTTKN